LECQRRTIREDLEVPPKRKKINTKGEKRKRLLREVPTAGGKTYAWIEEGISAKKKNKEGEDKAWWGSSKQNSLPPIFVGPPEEKKPSARCSVPKAKGGVEQALQAKGSGLSP